MYGDALTIANARFRQRRPIRFGIIPDIGVVALQEDEPTLE